MLIATIVSLIFSATTTAAVPQATEAPPDKTISWSNVGPGGGGWIQSLAWAPDDAGRLYVGCDVGGFYVSSDAGHSYAIHNQGLDDRFVERIAVCRQSPGTIYLGMESGVFRSSDGGGTWKAQRSGFPPLEKWRFSSPIGALVIDPLRREVIYAGIGRPRFHKGGAGAIYRSSDGGVSWHDVSAGQLPIRAVVNDLAIQPGQSRLLLAATDEGLFRSDDEGGIWKRSQNGLPHGAVNRLAFASSSPNVVYASLCTTARDKQPFNGGVYRSHDAGQHWQSACGEGLSHRVGQQGQPAQMTSSLACLAVDPHDADTVYAGDQSWVTAGVYKTTDGGRHWQRVTRWKAPDANMDYGWIDFWGPAVECLAVSPVQPNRVAFGTSGHVFVSDDGGRTWQQRYSRGLPNNHFSGTGLEVTCLNDVAADPRRPQRLYLCYFDIGLLISEDLGRSFRRSYQGMRNSGNCFAVAVDPAHTETIWAATGRWESNVGDVCLSRDDGRTWQVVGHAGSGLPDGQTHHLVLDSKSPAAHRRVLVTSKGNGLYETADGGKSWHAINGNLPAAARGEPRGLWLDPSQPRQMLTALDGAYSKGGGVYTTHDGGHTWTRVNRDAPWLSLCRVVVDPGNRQVLYAAARETYDATARRLYPGGLFKSSDGGQNWQQVLAARFVQTVAINPHDSRVVYAGTDDHPYHDRPLAQGVLRSSDGGVTWRQENTGLTHLNINCLGVSPYDPRMILMGTAGNGAFLGQELGR